MNVTILVAAHKKYWMPEDSVYLPLHVGKAGKENLGYQGDNTGDHISQKNANYCELTGLYWAWKNLEYDYIGLCHYRRYFADKNWGKSLAGKQNAIFHKADYENLLKRYDVIVPKKRSYYIETVRSQYEHAHFKNDIALVEKIISQEHKEYLEAFNKIMRSRSLHLYNMFVMKKKDFDRYCEWLFSILFKVERNLDLTGYDAYQARVFGFLGERLFNVWLEKERLSKIEVNVVSLEPVDWLDKGFKFLKRKFIR